MNTFVGLETRWCPLKVSLLLCHLMLPGCGWAPEPAALEYHPIAAHQLVVTSSAFENGGNLPAEFTCDGESVSPPVTWSGAPAATKCYALNLWHISPKPEFKSYWLIYDIPADVTSLPKNALGVGKVGYNGKHKTGYDPMCSKGSGVKEYHITVYALSADPKFTTDKVIRADLLTAIKDIALAEGTLNFKYERPAGKTGAVPLKSD